MSLLRNDGGRFADVTVAGGLSEPIASESAAWGDYDNDGFADVFVCGEYLPPGSELPLADARATPAIAAGCITTRAMGRSRTSPTAAGVTDLRCAKGSAWGDYDGDGRIDLFVSNMGQPCRLYHNWATASSSDVAPISALPGRISALRAGSGISTTTASWISTSTTTALAWPRCSRAPWA